MKQLSLGPGSVTRRLHRDQSVQRAFETAHRCGPYPSAEIAAELAEARKVNPEGTARLSQQAELAADQPQVLLFSRSEASLYTSIATLPQRAGVSAGLLAKLVAKEFTDNALDSADAAHRPGAVTISVDKAGNLTVADAGTGIPDATPEQLASLFCVARPMVSSKLLRLPTRGCVGNGLRVCLGYLAATGGRLVIETGNIKVTLAPEIDGTSKIVVAETIAPWQGLRLTAIAGDRPFDDRDLGWAEDAIELARQSGKAAFIGRPSTHWLDLDHFRTLLHAVVGNISVRQFLAKLDGCTGSKAQSRIAARFLRRATADLDAAEAAELLAAAQAATKPPNAKALRRLGRDAIVVAGYALAEGAFTEGAHAPYAQIPFLVECWADAFHPREQPQSLIGSLFLNRTRVAAVAPFVGTAWHNRLDLAISGVAFQVEAPAGPHYSLTVAITAPTYRLTSDGKMPDCRVFHDALIEATRKAAKQAGRDIAAQMSAADRREAVRLDQQRREEAARMSAEERRATALDRQQRREEAAEQKLSDREARQQRQALLATEKAERIAERKARPTIRDAVLELLPGAIARAEASGYLFNTRHLVYDIRETVRQRCGATLEQSYFDKLVTEIEAERGDLSPLLIREARGNFSIPHYSGAVPLGTQSVRAFRRPGWTFNKIVVIEKEDLRLMLQQAGWDRRHDALLMSSKGFNTRASRDLIDAIAETTEPVTTFSVHDADGPGTVIQHTLQHATLARGARKIEIINIGLEPWEGIALGLQVEKVSIKPRKDGKPIRKAVGAYVRARTDRAPNGETWEEWLQHSRVELNAFSSAELIAWLDRKMSEHDAGKLIPPDDVLKDGFGERVRERAERAVKTAISSRLHNLTAAIEAEQAKATAPIEVEIAKLSAPLLAEIDRLKAPLLAEIDRITAEPVKQLAETIAPFEARIAEARKEAADIDREAETHKAIERSTPDAERLRARIGEAFTASPRLHWATVLDEIANATEISATEIDLGDDAGGAP
jgi:hypothetical protein